MPRTLARCLLSVAVLAVLLAGLASSRPASADPAKKGGATAHELATESQTVPSLAPASKPKVRPTAKARPVGSRGSRSPTRGHVGERDAEVLLRERLERGLLADEVRGAVRVHEGLAGLELGAR